MFILSRILFALAVVVSAQAADAHVQRRSPTPAPRRMAAEDPRSRAMTFKAYQECSGNGCPYFVLAQGVITQDTPQAFRAFLAREQYQPVVYFDSPGGSLTWALELGRLIRGRGLDTYVGGPYEAFGGFRPGTGAEEVTRTLSRQGVCFSACAYAFLGGVAREIGDGGLYGVHRFYSGGRPLGDATTQVAMTVLAAYLDEMGVDRRLLDYASLTPSERLSTLPREVARRLSVDNTEPELSGWQLDTSRDGALYVYVAQRQPRHDATVTFAITRAGESFAGTIVYNINQKFRPAEDLDNIFLEESKEFPDYVHPPTVGGVEVTASQGWTRARGGGYVLRFALNRTAVDAMLKGDGFEFDPGFPRAYWDVAPLVTFSTAKLRESLIALTR